MYKIPANTLFMGQKLVYVPECHSTNSLLYDMNLQADLPEGTVVITSNQTAGRGQRGNSWEAAPDQNLTFSILLKPKFIEAKDQFQLNMAISLAVLIALQPELSQPIKLKWPNDIFVEDKKIGGILIESQLQGIALSGTIVGIGLNINQKLFASPLASSLHHFSGSFSELNTIFQRLMQAIECEYLDLRAGKIDALKRRYLASLYRIREPHPFAANTENFVGSITDVDEYGRLVVESGGITRKFSFQEVKFLN